MGSKYWVGGAVAVAQVSTVQVTAYDATTTYKITVGGTNGAPSVILSAIAAGSVNATATALAAAWNASTHPYCTGVTALATTDTVSFTADTAGVPFVISKSVSGGTGTLGSVTAVTASSGPNDWSTAANWSDGAIPANSDYVYCRNSSIPVLWGLAQSGVTPSLLAIERSFIAQLGLNRRQFATSATGSNANYPEYRDTYLAIGAAVVRIGEGYGSNANGSSLVKIDLGSTNAAISVISTGTADDQGPAFYLRANHASATCKIYSGKVAIDWEVPGETGQLAEIDVYNGGASATGAIFVGDGVTLATHNQYAGEGTLKCLPTTLRVEAGAKVTLANPVTGTITTLEQRGTLVPAGVAFAVTNLKV